MEIRSFLAFELPKEIKGIVARVWGEVTRSSLEVRWVKADNIHLTVVFMGNVQEETLESMTDVIRGVCMEFQPFPISLKGMGCFPNIKYPRVIWIGLEGDVERMSRFKDALQAQLKSFGIKEEERGFRPHLTLGRFKTSRRQSPQLEGVLSAHRDLASPVCLLGDLSLFRSDLKPGGAVYTRLSSWPLKGVA